MRIFFVGAKAQAKICYRVLLAQGHSGPLAYDADRSVTPPWPGCRIVHDWDEAMDRIGECDAFIVTMANERRGKRRSELSYELTKRPLTPVTAIHPTLHEGWDVRRGAGLQSFARTVIGDETLIGNWCVLGLSAVMDHNCVLGDGVTVMNSAAVAGYVRINNYASIGANATVLPGLTIGESSIVGAGAVVTKDVEPGITVVGAPAKPIRRKQAEAQLPQE